VNCEEEEEKKGPVMDNTTVTTYGWQTGEQRGLYDGIFFPKRNPRRGIG